MGFLSSIGKAFKSVVKAVSKVAVVVLAAAAVVYTAGAVLKVASMAGGWATAAGSLVSSLGATGTLGSTLAGALTYAGYGAAAGGVMAAITGKNVMKGMTTGALTGAITGGLTGALSPSAASFGAAEGTALKASPSLNSAAAEGVGGAAPAQAATGTGIEAAGKEAVQNAVASTGGSGELMQSGLSVDQASKLNLISTPTLAKQPGMIGGIVDFGKSMFTPGQTTFQYDAQGRLIGATAPSTWGQSLVGEGLKGLASGLMAPDTAEQELAKQKQQQEWQDSHYSGNIAGGSGMQYSSVPSTSGLGPSAPISTGGGRMVFDTALNKYVWVKG